MFLRLIPQKVLCAVLLIAAVAFSNDYQIQTFNDGSDYSGEPDAYIKAEFANQLKVVDGKKILDNRFYLRQKYEDPFEDDLVDYLLYEGLATGAVSRLAKFEASGIPYQALLKCKLYFNQGAPADEDVEKVYFDGKFVYVESEEVLYCKNQGKMVELKASDEKEVFIELSSSPAGAEVWIDNKLKGKTPLKFSSIGTKPVTVTVKKVGYYDLTKVIKPVVGKTIADGALLSKKQTLVDPVSNLEGKLLQIQNSKNSTALASFHTELKSIIANFPVTIKKDVDAIMNGYPPNPGKRDTESAEDYNARTEQWEKDRLNEKETLDKDVTTFSNRLQALLARTESLMESVQFTLNYVGFEADAVKVGLVRGKVADIEVTGQKDKVNFSWKGSVKTDMSKKELTDNAESLAAVVKYWNLTDAAERPFAYHGVDIYLDTELLEPSGKGKFTIPNSGFIEAKQITAKGEGFDAKVKGLSGPEKSEWEANDRSRSLAALPKKAVAKPVPTVVAPVVAPPPISEPEPEPEYSPENDADLQDDANEDYAYQDESVDEAREAISAQFSDADEYRRWAAWTLVGLATVSSVMWYMQNSEAGNADKAVQATEDKISATEQQARDRCVASPDPQCYAALIQALKDPANTNFNSLYLLEGYLKDNKAARDSYQGAATLWLTATGLSIAGSIVLFAW